MAQWLPALLLILPAALVATAVWRPGVIRALLAASTAIVLDLATYGAFWLQGEHRSRADTVRLLLFLAVPAGLMTLAALAAFLRAVGARVSPARAALGLVVALGLDVVALAFFAAATEGRFWWVESSEAFESEEVLSAWMAFVAAFAVAITLAALAALDRSRRGAGETRPGAR